MVKKQHANAGDRFNPRVSKITWRRKWPSIHSSTFLENSMDSGAWEATVHGVAKN